MDKINEIIEWFKNINMNTIIDILIAILIFLLFKLFSGALSYLISKIFKIKEKNKNKLKQNPIYKTLNIFFPLLGAYLGLKFLNLESSTLNLNLSWGMKGKFSNFHDPEYVSLS